MTAVLDAAWAADWVQRSSEAITANRTHLIDLDRAIGDGDHGENLSRGFAAAAQAVAEASPATPREVLTLVAKTLLSTVGGASGPLYGSVFLSAAKSAPETLDAEAVAALVDAGREGVARRGKAVPGEKTMVDAWTPAAEAARAAADAGATPAEVLRAAADAAAAGALATEPLVATKGRASYLGERAREHRDPGAESTSLVLAAAADAAAP